MSSIIINNLPNIEELSYLELGVFDNSNFNQIKSNKKFSVDMNGNAMFTGTTDDYFSQLDPLEKFDIIFIDANHDYDYVVRDFNNSVDHATQWILMHDMIPPKEKYTRPHKCSDSFRVLYHMLAFENFEIYPMNCNFGFTLIKMPANKIYPDAEKTSITFKEFSQFISTKKLYTEDEIIKILKDSNV